MKTSQSIQLLDTNDTNISPIVGVESIFYEQAENNKRKILSDKLLLSGKDGSLSINTVSYDDASDKNIIVNLSTSKLDGADGSLFKLDVTQVSMTDFMGVIEEMIEEGGGGGGELGPVNASIRDISNRLANVSDNVDVIGQSVDELDEEYNELNTSFGILDTSVGKLWDSSKHNDASVKALWDSSMSGGGDVSINDIKIQDLNTYSHSIVNQTTKIADISIKTINNQSLIGLGNITISGGGDASIYDIRVGDSQQSAVDANKIARIYRSDFITDASVDAWNNGGLISGTSQLGTINNIPFIYGQNVNVSADEVTDIKYGSRAQVYYKYTQSGSTTYKNIPEGTILIKPIYFEPSFWGILSIFSDGSGRVKYKDGNTETFTTEISLSEPILIIGKNSTVYNSSALSDDCYLNKSSINLSNAYSEFFNMNNEFKPFRTIYLCGSVTTYYGTQDVIFQLNKTPIITTEIDILDLDKYYIPIGYSYDETQVPHASGESYSSLTSKMHFYGGIPRIYKYNSQTGRLEEHHLNESGGGSFDPSNINSSITNVSTRLNDVSIRLNNVSTRLDASVTNINSSITNVSTRLNDVSTKLDSSITEVKTSINNILTTLNGPTGIEAQISDINSSILDISTKLDNIIIPTSQYGGVIGTIQLPTLFSNTPNHILSFGNIFDIDLDEIGDYINDWQDVSIYIKDDLFASNLNNTFGVHGEKSVELRFLDTLDYPYVNIHFIAANAGVTPVIFNKTEHKISAPARAVIHRIPDNRSGVGMFNGFYTVDLW